MKGSNKTLLLVAGTVGGILLYEYISKKVNTVGNLSAKIAAIHFGKFQFPNLECLIGVEVTNGSNQDARAESFRGDLTDEAGNVLGKFDVLFNTAQDITVPRLSTARIDVNTTVNLLGAASTLIQGRKVKVDGFVVIDKIPVPVKTDVSIGCTCTTT